MEAQLEDLRAEIEIDLKAQKFNRKILKARRKTMRLYTCILSRQQWERRTRSINQLAEQNQYEIAQKLEEKWRQEGILSCRIHNYRNQLIKEEKENQSDEETAAAQAAQYWPIGSTMQ